MTVRQLVYHSSGLRDTWFMLKLMGHSEQDALRQQQFLNIVARQRGLNFKPGSEALYCNVGYVLLAEIVRAASGQTLQDFASARIFQPLGMTQTRFHGDVSGTPAAIVPPLSLLDSAAGHYMDPLAT